MTIPNWAASEVVSVSKLNEMVDFTPEKKVIHESQSVPNEGSNNSRPTLPDWKFPLGIIGGRYLVVIWESNVFVSGTAHIEMTINFMNQKILWEDVTVTTNTAVFFRALDLSNISGLAVSDLTGLPVSLEVRRWVDATKTLQQDFFHVLFSDSNVAADHDFYDITDAGP